MAYSEKWERMIATCKRKVAYPDKITAMISAAQLVERWEGLNVRHAISHNHGNKPVRRIRKNRDVSLHRNADLNVYECRVCGLWHLTKEEQREDG